MSLLMLVGVPYEYDQWRKCDLHDLERQLNATHRHRARKANERAIVAFNRVAVLTCRFNKANHRNLPIRSANVEVVGAFAKWVC